MLWVVNAPSQLVRHLVGVSVVDVVWRGLFEAELSRMSEEKWVKNQCPLCLVILSYCAQTAVVIVL